MDDVAIPEPPLTSSPNNQHDGILKNASSSYLSPRLAASFQVAEGPPELLAHERHRHLIAERVPILYGLKQLANPFNGPPDYGERRVERAFDEKYQSPSGGRATLCHSFAES